MKMIDYNHFICHFHCRFSVFSHILLSGARNEFPGKSLMTSSSASVGKIISFRFHRLFLTLPIISPPFSSEFRTFIHNNNLQLGFRINNKRTHQLDTSSCFFNLPKE